MAPAAVETFFDRWLNDQVFRARFRADPVAAVRSSGVELDVAVWAALRSVDWNVSATKHEACP